MRRPITAFALVCTMLAGSAQAQTYWSAPARAGTAAGTYFPIGTPLSLVTRAELSTKVAKSGDRFYLEVAEPLRHHGQVVIPAGAVAVGEVIRSQRNGHLGKKGKIDVRLLYVDTPSGPVRLQGRAADEGVSGTAASIATMAFVSAIGGFFIHGTSARLPAGTVVQAYLADDLRFTVSADGIGEVARPAAAPDRFDPQAFAGGDAAAGR